MHIQLPDTTSWDEAKRRRNLAVHDVDFAGLTRFFDGDFVTWDDAREAYGELRLQSIGYLNDMMLCVVWSPRGDAGETAHIISARRANKYEAQAWFKRYAKN